MKSMHKLDIDLVEMTMDVMKYTLNRISNTSPDLGAPKTETKLLELVGDTITENGIGGEKALSLFKDVLVKATVPVDHPKNFAFVPASPTRASILFDLITSASSIHGAYWMEGAGAIFCENRAMEWLVSLTGLPDTAFGVFTSGGTVANLSAMVTARHTWREKKESRKVLRSLMLTSKSAHSSVKSMAKVIDADVVAIGLEDDKMTGKMVREALADLSEIDRERLFAVVATAGTTNAGIIDDLKGIAEVCDQEEIWLHVDAAYGGGALAAPSVRHRFNGIEKADSITIDPHKWLFSPYDCGAILYRDMTLAEEAHSQKGPYLSIFKDEGAYGFNPADYQIQLTRRVRGLPLWFSLAMHGTKRYQQAIERGLELAQIAERHIDVMDFVEMVRPVSLSCVLFRRKGWDPEDYREWTYRNHQSGFALVTPTQWRNKETGEHETVARFCFINPDTTQDDIVSVLESMHLDS